MHLEENCGKKGSCMKPLFRCEKFKLLKVIGEQVVQVVSDTFDCLECPAKEILDITIDVVDMVDHPFVDKVVKQGIIRKKVLYCDTAGVARCQIFNIRFTATADIPGVDPNLELDIQNKVLSSAVDFKLIDKHTLMEKIVLDIRIKASTWVQEKIRVCNSNVVNCIQVGR